MGFFEAAYGWGEDPKKKTYKRYESCDTSLDFC